MNLYEAKKKTILKLFSQTDFSIAKIADLMEEREDFVKSVLKEAGLI